MRDYAKKYNIVGGKWGYEELCAYFNRACAEAIRDTKRSERRRAARIVLSYPCQLILDKHTDEVRVYLAKRILGKKGAKR